MRRPVPIGFQFLTRNSVCSDSARMRIQASTYSSVSIPHSEFCLFGPRGVFWASCRRAGVSIPHSEFCLFGQLRGKRIVWAAETSFNSSLGILSVRTCRRCSVKARWTCCFNSSLGILSVRTMACIEWAWSDATVSIPHSEFCLFGLPLPGIAVQWYRLFQFLTRNSVCSDRREVAAAIGTFISFNSSLGILSVRTPYDPLPWMQANVVSIPHSEFCLFGQVAWLVKPLL